VIALTDGSGAVTQVNTYDEYGMPGASNSGRFGYTGQMWLPEAGLYHYRARAYAPGLGRFLQPDPIGYRAGMNLYAYVGNDPVNWTDPLGMDGWELICNDPAAYENGEYAGTVEGTGAGQCTLRYRPSIAGFLLELFGSRPGGGWRGYADGGFGSCGADCVGPSIQSDPTYADYNAARLGALQRNSWMVDVALAPWMVVEAPVIVAGRGAGIFARLCNCFVAGTKVQTEDGLKPIEWVRVGDRVLARDEVTGDTALRPVAALIDGAERLIWEVTVQTADASGRTLTETFGTTDEHPWRLADGRWAETADLRAGLRIVTQDADQAVIVSVVRTDRREQTYNLEVEGFHSYFIGEAELWVHNACRSASQRAAFLRELAEHPNTPSWMRQWLSRGRSPPGYVVHHNRPLSVGGPDTPANMTLRLQRDHIIHHRYHRPWL
jgi:RHS repeat-associated protein